LGKNRKAPAAMSGRNLRGKKTTSRKRMSGGKANPARVESNPTVPTAPERGTLQGTVNGKVERNKTDWGKRGMGANRNFHQRICLGSRKKHTFERGGLFTGGKRKSEVWENPMVRESGNPNVAKGEGMEKEVAHRIPKLD